MQAFNLWLLNESGGDTTRAVAALKNALLRQPLKQDAAWLLITATGRDARIDEDTLKKAAEIGLRAAKIVQAAEEE